MIDIYYIINRQGYFFMKKIDTVKMHKSLYGNPVWVNKKDRAVIEQAKIILSDLRIISGSKKHFDSEIISNLAAYSVVSMKNLTDTVRQYSYYMNESFKVYSNIRCKNIYSYMDIRQMNIEKKKVSFYADKMIRESTGGVIEKDLPKTIADILSRYVILAELLNEYDMDMAGVYESLGELKAIKKTGPQIGKIK